MQVELTIERMKKQRRIQTGKDTASLKTKQNKKAENK